MRVWFGLPILCLAYVVSFVSRRLAVRLRSIACAVSGKREGAGP